MTKAPCIYIIAGEASGDFIGSELMAALKQEKPTASFHGLGGERMLAQGLSSLFPMQEISLMGFAEILPHARRLKRRIRETVQDIIVKQPDVVVTIDSPGFTTRVIKQLRKSGQYNGKCLHYVAPTVWAYKPKRARHFAELFDALMVLLPFEPPYFEAENLLTYFVGHPVAWDWRKKGDRDAFRKRHQIHKNAVTIGMMPGSRAGEIKRHMPLFQQVIEYLSQHLDELEIVMPLRASMEPLVRQYIRSWKLSAKLVVGDEEKKDAFAACDVALAKSGTVALETALAGIPTVTAYKANRISVWLIKRMATIPYVNLVNIIRYFQHKPAVIPEYIQQECIPSRIAATLRDLCISPEVRFAQLDGFRDIAAQLGANQEKSPSEKAAAIVLEHLSSTQIPQTGIVAEEIEQNA